MDYELLAKEAPEIMLAEVMLDIEMEKEFIADFHGLAEVMGISASVLKEAVIWVGVRDRLRGEEE